VVLGNTPTKETSFAVEANKSYAFGVWFRTAKGDELDISDCTVRLVVADASYRGGSELIVLEAVPVGDSHGLVQFQFQAEDLSLDPGAYPYDITLIPSSGYSTPILKGFIEVGANTDLDTSNRYTSVNRGSDITAYMEGTDLVYVTIERVDGLYTVVEEMIRDVMKRMQEQTALAAAAVKEAQDAAAFSKAYADELRTWLTSVGYPFWEGTQEQYNDIPSPQPSILYLIVEATP
jgi:hypothetical protein